MNVLQKRLRDITAQDIQWLIDNEVQESSDLEFKEALSTRTGAPDRWVVAGDKVGDDAKSDLVKELVGFANAQGGLLVLGIKDSKQKPAKAAGLSLVPKVCELADRLKMTCRDWIEPKVHSLEVRGVTMGDHGSGVVVFRVNGGSPLGPHRHRGTRECYIRRNDETMPMDMIEIQRHSIELQQRLSRIDKEFVSVRTSIHAATGTFRKVRQPWFGISVHAIPLGALHVPSVHRQTAAKPSLATIPVRFPKGSPSEAIVPIHSHLNWRPVLRGTSVRVDGQNQIFGITIGNDGRITLEWAEHVMQDQSCPDKPVVFVGWMTGAFANVLLGIERIRLAAAAPSAEFAIEFVYMGTLYFAVGDYNHQWHATPYRIAVGEHVFPRYSVGTRNQFNNLTRLFERDVVNLSGADHPGQEPEYDFSAALAAIDQSFATGN